MLQRNKSARPPRGDHPDVSMRPPFLFALGFSAGVLLQTLFSFPEFPLAFRAVGGILVAAAALLLGSAFLLFRKAGTSENPLEPTTTLVTWGPYRFSRNPFYLAYVLGYIGGAILFAAPLALLVLPFVVLALHF
ncbi:hypothetical protein D6833_06415, partial [Candidatus Parcubacteria bacterium]